MADTVLALIPARGGSKGVPKKNIKSLAAKPLISYTCRAALGSRSVSRVIVSTDDTAIALAARASGAEVPFMRPKRISGDKSTAFEVCQHALRWLDEHEHWRPKILIYLQPTSPFRSSKHIDDAMAVFRRNQLADTLVSVMPVPHRFLPEKLMRRRGRYAVPLSGKIRLTNRQETRELYARNGPAIVICSVENITRRHRLYGSRIIPFVVDDFSFNIDIDTIDDFTLADMLMRQRQRRHR